MSKPSGTNPSTLQDKFNQDKEDLLNQTQAYLAGNTSVPQSQTVGEMRREATQAVKDGDLGKALRDLEKMRDARTGIVTTEIPGANGTPILVRDARQCEPNKAARGTETFEIQCINNYRAAIDVANLEGNGELAASLQEKAANFIDNFHQNNSERSQKDLSELAKKETKSIAATMKSHGVEAPALN